MSSCSDNVCGTGGWNGPLPGDPSNNSILSATPAFGGIDVSWTYPATHPEAVAHVQLYRGISPSFSTAMLLSIVSGSFFYDKSTSTLQTRYYYWIKIVSVNGTIGELIGPASAVAKPTIEDMIVLLTGKIDNGALATSLKTDIDKININYAEFQSETLKRLAADSAFSSLLAQVQAGVTGAINYLDTEIINRTEGDSTLLAQINTVAAANANNLSLLTNSYYTKVATDAAITVSKQDLIANTLSLYPTTAYLSTNYLTKTQTNSAISSATTNLVSNATLSNTLSQYASTASLRSVLTTQIGYAALSNSTTPYDGNGSTVVYPASVYPYNEFPEYAIDRTRIIDANGVTRWNATPAGAIRPLTWLVGLPLASAIETAQITDPVTGSVTSVSVGFSAQKTLNDQFKALWTAKVSVDGLVGGFGIYNDGRVVEAGFDVDRFWVGRTSANKKKPFIIENGQVYIDDAVINKLTFTKLRDESGAVMVENGKLKADYITVNQFNAGTFTGYAWPASGAGAHISSAGMLMGNLNGPGAWMSFHTNPSSSFFVLGSAGQGRVMLDSAGNLTLNGKFTADAINAVGTLNIAGQAVTVPVGSQGYGAIPRLVMYMSEPGTIFVSVMANALATGGGEASLFVDATCNGVSGGKVGISLGDGYSGSATAIGSFSVGAGYHTVSGTVTVHISGRTIAATGIFAIGVKR